MLRRTLALMTTRPHGDELTDLEVGQRIPFGGSRYTVVDESLALAFRAGDRLIVVQETGDLIHVPAEVSRIVDDAVGEARQASLQLPSADPKAVKSFFDTFARMLEDDKVFESIADANSRDVASAKARGRATGRLELTTKMRTDMIGALRMWRDLEIVSDQAVDTIAHQSWSVEERRAPLGVVAFVFEGRPNVFADATGVLRSGNSVVFRIGSDALLTARAIMDSIVRTALVASGLPTGSVVLVDSVERAAGHALFSDRRVGLAVARGSGDAVAQLGAVARQAGIPVSLHGTGGAWMLVDNGYPVERISAIVDASLDRKVCNTVNVICVQRSDHDSIRGAITGIVSASSRRHGRATVHCSSTDRRVLEEIMGRDAEVLAIHEHADTEFLSIEWEWDDDPEVSIVLVDGLGHATDLFNLYSPQFIVSVLSTDRGSVEKVYLSSNAPFVGDGFTRWVDGQYALGRPELGLSNWQSGRLFARGGILSGDGVYSVRYMARHSDPHQRR